MVKLGHLGLEMSQLVQHAISSENGLEMSQFDPIVKLGHLGLEMSQLVQHAISRSNGLEMSQLVQIRQ